MIKPGLIAAMLLLAAAMAADAEGGKVQVPPLGFITLDLTREFWASIDDVPRLKGGVVDVLPFAGIKGMINLRCNMPVPGVGHLEQFIRGRPAEGARFAPGPVSDRAARDLHSPLPTVLVETVGGDLGLATIDSHAAFLGFNGRRGLLSTK